MTLLGLLVGNNWLKSGQESPYVPTKGGGGANDRIIVRSYHHMTYKHWHDHL